MDQQRVGTASTPRGSTCMSRMTWQELLTAAGPGSSTAYEWLWQDLDGLHLSPLPSEPPPTSIMWGWPDPVPGRTPDISELWRVRLDGATVYAARPTAGTSHPVLPWGGLDQVAQMRCADGLAAADVRQMSFVEVVEDLPSDGSVPLTFYYRVQSAT